MTEKHWVHVNSTKSLHFSATKIMVPLYDRIELRDNELFGLLEGYRMVDLEEGEEL